MRSHHAQTSVFHTGVNRHQKPIHALLSLLSKKSTSSCTPHIVPLMGQKANKQKARCAHTVRMYSHRHVYGNTLEDEQHMEEQKNRWTHLHTILANPSTTGATIVYTYSFTQSPNLSATQLEPIGHPERLSPNVLLIVQIIGRGYELRNQSVCC